MSTTPINEAGITATFAAIFARLEELEHGQEDHHTRLERLESARIAPQVAPESAETASGVPQEPGNATEAHGPQLADAALEYVHGALMEIANALGVRTASDYEEGQDAPNWKLVERILATAGEVAAALRMYRKVQALTVVEACGIMRVTYELAAPEVTALLAWLKEGEA